MRNGAENILSVEAGRSRKPAVVSLWGKRFQEEGATPRLPEEKIRLPEEKIHLPEKIK